MVSQFWTVNSKNWYCWYLLLVYDSSFIKNKGCNMILCCSLRWISPYKSKHWYKYATTTGGNKKGILLLRRKDCIIAPIIVGAMIYHFRNSISIYYVVKSDCWRNFFTLLHTVWKFHDFAIIRILHEINFEEYRSSKPALFVIFRALHNLLIW